MFRWCCYDLRVVDRLLRALALVVAARGEFLAVYERARVALTPQQREMVLRAFNYPQRWETGAESSGNGRRGGR